MYYIAWASFAFDHINKSEINVLFFCEFCGARGPARPQRERERGRDAGELHPLCAGGSHRHSLAATHGARPRRAAGRAAARPDRVGGARAARHRARAPCACARSAQRAAAARFTYYIQHRITLADSPEMSVSYTLVRETRREIKAVSGVVPPCHDLHCSTVWIWVS